MTKSNLGIKTNAAYSYDTCIAVFYNGVAIINATKYSTTTSKHQTKVRYYARENGYKVDETSNLPFGATENMVMQSYLAIRKRP